MASKILDNINMGMSWTTYMGSVHGVLKGAGFWDDSVEMLMGMTGMAFHFIVHSQTCPSSVTVYNWVSEHFLMMDRIGICSESTHIENPGNLNTFDKARTMAVSRIKESIDNGIGVVVWAPTPVLEFGIINGYDDDDEVFFVQDCMNKSPDPLLYSNLGKSEVPVLFIQRFYDRINVEPEKIFRDSLHFGLYQWERGSNIPMYASGRGGYLNLINALEKKDFNPFGLAYLLAVYADSKRNIENYIKYIISESKYLKGLDEASDIYGDIKDKYNELTELVPFRGPGQGELNDKNIGPVLKLFKECLDLEERAMGIIKRSLDS
ncbi:MAG: hypothetical protein PVG39_21690 [Desulfobacteraceae bacterium]|jgi:hypothetical protein